MTGNSVDMLRREHPWLIDDHRRVHGDIQQAGSMAPCPALPERLPVVRRDRHHRVIEGSAYTTRLADLPHLVVNEAQVVTISVQFGQLRRVLSGNRVRPVCGIRVVHSHKWLTSLQDFFSYDAPGAVLIPDHPTDLP